MIAYFTKNAIFIFNIHVIHMTLKIILQFYISSSMYSSVAAEKKDKSIEKLLKVHCNKMVPVAFHSVAVCKETVMKLRRRKV